MPCYSSWDTGLEEGSVEYKQTRAAVARSLACAQHIVDYYLLALELDSSLLKRHLASDLEPNKQMPKKVSKYLEMVAHHLNCDGINFIGVYDVCTLLDTRDQHSHFYDLVLSRCAFEMRSNAELYPQTSLPNRRHDPLPIPPNETDA